MTTIIPVPAFTDNYIWVMRDGPHAVVVDPGDAAPVLAYLDAEGLTLSAIVATHHHNDHVGGIPGLIARFDVPVYGPANETIPRRTQALREGDSITLPALDLKLSVLDIPGHTAGHVALYSTADEILFCGDTLFAAGCGRLFEGTPAQMWSSLSKLAALALATRVFCGHEYTLNNGRFALTLEPENAELSSRMRKVEAARAKNAPTIPSTIGLEKKTNPFLRPGSADIRRSLGLRDAGDVEVFEEMRRRKDSF